MIQINVHFISSLAQKIHLSAKKKSPLKHQNCCNSNMFLNMLRNSIFVGQRSLKELFLVKFEEYSNLHESKWKFYELFLIVCLMFNY